MQRVALGAGILILIIAAMIAVRVQEGASRSEEDAQRISAGDPGGFGGTLGSGKSSRKSSDAPVSTNPKGPIYTGPNSLEEWLVPRSENPTPNSNPTLDAAWNYADGTLYKLNSTKSGSIAREISTSALTKISFHLRWKKNLRFRMIFFGSQAESPSPENCYDLVIQRRFVYIRKRWQREGSAGSRIIGQANISVLAEAETALFEFYFSREEGTIVFFINGTRKHIWSDQDPSEGEFGDWFQFAGEVFHPVEVSQITVERWDGVLPDSRDRNSPHFEPDPARVAELTPPLPWAPAEVYRREKARIRADLRATLATAEGPDRQAANHAAVRANVEALNRYNQSLQQLPEAQLDPSQPGHVINPFTGESLDVLGIEPGSRIWDPRSGRKDQVFRIPAPTPPSASEDARP